MLYSHPLLIRLVTSPEAALTGHDGLLSNSSYCFWIQGRRPRYANDKHY
ncbi:MAG: hypothetical protein F6J94_08305 [Moorea sp. SIO1F2]|nr:MULTISPECIES: hypothetical protein [unclassified Moorena]NEO23796.1 hypothetical protein [Moorena sp. SIO4A5]NEQ56010.1 hypothetical protein [Moorena sp. SIO4A1]NET81942.1 hypothetical protein [Moorena sp. SIO1F2]